MVLVEPNRNSPCWLWPKNIHWWLRWWQCGGGGDVGGEDEEPVSGSLVKL